MRQKTIKEMLKESKREKTSEGKADAVIEEVQESGPITLERFSVIVPKQQWEEVAEIIRDRGYNVDKDGVYKDD